MPNPLLEERETPLEDDGERAPKVEKESTRETPLAAADEPEKEPEKKPDDEPPAVKALRGDLDGIKSYLGNLHTFLTAKFAEATGGAKPPAGAIDAAVEAVRSGELTAEELADKPAEALNKFFDAKMGPLVNEYRQDRVLDNYNRTKAEKKDWAKYEPKIAQMMQQVSADELAKPGAFEILYKLARADDIDNLLKEEFERGRKSVGDDDERITSAHVRSGGPSETSKVRLSPIEKKLAEQFGMSDAEWVANKAVEKPAAR